MKLLKIFVLCLSLILSACNGGKKSSSSPDPQINNKKADPARSCVPEDELLARNIIAGQLVQQNDPDSKMVLMIHSNGQLCTATAIRKNVILTAAHCIGGGVDVTFAAFYSSLSCESGYNKYEHRQKVSKIYIHEEYRASAPADQMTGDIALVILQGEIPSGYEMFDIANPSLIDNQSDMYLYGYGRIRSGEDSGAGAGMLRKTSLDSSAYSIDLVNKKVKVDQSNGTGICQGDSGGPAFVNVGNQKMILGINSYVRGPESDICSRESYQTLAYAYLAWINSKIDPFGK
ncbi:MAG: trypsin-like serine protease [Pseudobdellovibrio sp.]